MQNHQKFEQHCLQQLADNILKHKLAHSYTYILVNICED